MRDVNRSARRSRKPRASAVRTAAAPVGGSIPVGGRTAIRRGELFAAVAVASRRGSRGLKSRCSLPKLGGSAVMAAGGNRTTA